MKLTKQKASLAKEIERLESKLLETKQEEERLKSENLKIKLHTGLIEVITTFQKNALHYQAVMLNEISEKIEKHPELSDTFKDWTKNDLAKRAAENGKGDTSTGEEAELFAVEAITRELVARGKSIDSIGALGARWPANKKQSGNNLHWILGCYWFGRWSRQKIGTMRPCIVWLR